MRANNRRHVSQYVKWNIRHPLRLSQHFIEARYRKCGTKFSFNIINCYVWSLFYYAKWLWTGHCFRAHFSKPYLNIVKIESKQKCWKIMIFCFGQTDFFQDLVFKLPIWYFAYQIICTHCSFICRLQVQSSS